MQTLKTAVVVVLLIAVCYGAFIALNAPEDDIPSSIQQWASEDLDSLAEVEFPDEFQVDTSGAVPMTPESWSLDSTDLPLPSEPTAIPTTQVSNPADSDTAALPQLPELPSLESAASGSLDSSIPAISGSTTTAPNAQTTELSIPELPGASSNGTKGTFASTKTSNDATLPSSPELPLPTLMDPSLSEPALPEATAQGNDNANGPSATLAIPPLLSNEAPTSSNSASSQPTSPTATESVPNLPFDIAKEQALGKAYAGDIKAGLELLSRYYESPELGGDEHADLVNILDALSREAIYSKRHLLEPAYHAAAVDTVASIASAHQITPELLAVINGIETSKALPAGTQLKIVQGPFRARISLSRREMTVFLGDLYAGRFPVSLGQDGPPSEGVFAVVERRRDRTYYGPGETVIKANEPDNPYGGYWLSLGNNLAIHGSPEMSRSELANAGCISLAPLDAADAFIILTENSKVEIRR